MKVFEWVSQELAYSLQTVSPCGKDEASPHLQFEIYMTKPVHVRQGYSMDFHPLPDNPCIESRPCDQETISMLADYLVELRQNPPLIIIVSCI